MITRPDLKPTPDQDPASASVTHSRLQGHMEMLCTEIGERPTGSAGSREAEEYIRKILETLGYEVELQKFPTRTWTVQEAACRCGGETVPVVVNPYSPSCSTTAPAVWVGTMDDLRGADLRGKILIAEGELTAEPLMPRNFRFYQHEPHQELVALIEEKGPAALITISPRSDYPVPVIIDGDFELPSCTVTAIVGDRLRSRPDEPVTLVLKTGTRPTEAANVIGRSGTGRKIVLSAHLDTKFGTVGALDNASGVAALLLLAERFSERPPAIGLEFVFFNGEECYAAPGEGAYLDAGYCDPGKVSLAINVDGIGLRDMRSSIAYFGCPETIVAAAEEARSAFPDLVPVDPWPQGDHMIFLMAGIPAMAISTHAEPGVVEGVIHTPFDTLAGLDEGLIEETVAAIEAIIRAVDREEPAS
jgi:aminopeptidase YwaD